MRSHKAPQVKCS